MPFNGLFSVKKGVPVKKPYGTLLVTAHMVFLIVFPVSDTEREYWLCVFSI